MNALPTFIHSQWAVSFGTGLDGVDNKWAYTRQLAAIGRFQVLAQDSNRTSSIRRRALGELLSAARTSITPPLSADEFAGNSGVGRDWYLSLEEGRDVGLSTTALGWVADALYRCGSMPTNRRNMLLCLFAQPESRRFIVNWEDQARAAVEMVGTNADPEDRRLAELVEHLGQTSADFPRLWREADGPQSLRPTRKVFTRPPVGRLEFICSYLVPAGDERLRLTVYHADNDKTARRLPALVAAQQRRTDGQSRKARAVQQVRAFLDEHYRDEVPLDELVALSGISRYTLLRWFVAEIGLPPRAYQLLVRVARARQLLLRGAPAAEVAISVGFNDQSHLIRRFRQLEGMTPGEYVRRLAPVAVKR